MPREGRIPGPNTGFEVFVPGRQGIRAMPRTQSRLRERRPPWDLPPRSFLFLPVVSRPRPREWFSSRLTRGRTEARRTVLRVAGRLRRLVRLRGGAHQQLWDFLPRQLWASRKGT